PVAVIEIKGANTDLDTDRSNGRTAVQQCWDYLNALPEAAWGIVSNFSEIRLYNKEMGNQAFEVFTLQQLRDIIEFRKFWCLLERGGLLKSGLGQEQRAQLLVTESSQRQRQVGDELYNYYSEQRARLIEHLRQKHSKSLDEAIHIAQKLFDRIVFVAFCQDRGFLNRDAIRRSYETIPPFFRVTNPRWQNFLSLFHAVDKGAPNTELEHGYNGGLFTHDPQVDDLQLEDAWTTVFFEIGRYDFKDEVNVDVLGHLFERSITELEKMRVAGVFAEEAVPGPSPKMLKSAERKRFGIYYTPPEFTEFLVRGTAGELINQRFENLKKAHEIKPEDEDSREPQPRVAAYYQQCLTTLRNFKIVDPACGSGAFLIAAYDMLEDYYVDVIRNLKAQGVPGADELFASIPDMIVTENLYGVDLSEQAVEITRLALWIKTVRYDKTLADLSRNIVWGNSLVHDPVVQVQGMEWPLQFPDVFSASRPFGPGFDAVVGNPPWERLKVQIREFFAFSSPEIVSAVNPSEARNLIAGLRNKNPELYNRYEKTQKAAERVLEYARQSGRYPLTGKGDINTYMLFAELARSLVAPYGRVGLLVPSGIATDNTTKEFFAELIENESLIKLYDFENKEGVFEDVHRAFKFCTLIFGGSAVQTSVVDFAFFIHNMDELEDSDRHITLSKKDIALLNPNTHTCPIFRTRRDCEITKSIYRRVPILIDRSRKEGGNSWELRFGTMFHQSFDSEKFHNAAQLTKLNFKFAGSRWLKGKEVFLPCYEAKMFQQYDHRAAGVVVQEENWLRKAQVEPTSLVSHQNPEFVAVPRWWVREEHVREYLGPDTVAYVAFRKVTSPTNQRTMLAAVLPAVGLIDSGQIAHLPPAMNLSLRMCLLANLNSFVLDYVCRQKIANVNLNFFVVEQLPALPPDAYTETCPWDKKQTLEKWISDRVLKLTCTANDMIPLADAAGFKEKVHKWKDTERAEMRAELDAAYFHLYGINRDDAIYILSTFQATGSADDLYSTAALVMEKYDKLRGATAAAN
ncbi:MAG: Eco57I restriction-modification methylase domain-containing protein, partial [Phycisphaerae bacterium]